MTDQLIKEESWMKLRDILEARIKELTEENNRLKAALSSTSCTSSNSIEQDEEEDFDSDEPCNYCGMDNGKHLMHCPNDTDPYHELLINGYD